MTVGLLTAALAAFLWTAPTTGARLRDLGLPSATNRTSRTAAVAQPSTGPRSSDRSPPGRRWWTAPWLSALVAAITVSQVVGGVAGVVAGLACAAGVVTLLRHTSAAHVVRRRARIIADLPLTVDLLVACVAAGHAPGQALSVVSGCVGGPLAEELGSVCARLELGADARTVWSELAAHETLGPLGRALARSSRTGSSVTSTLSRCAEDLRRDRRALADANARKVGVRASAPLGVCFLPAFFLIGIVPTIVGGIASMQW